MLPETFTPRFLSQLELLKLNARRAFLGHRQGGHLSLKRGHGIEFFDYRRYELGDNPRHIDWNLYGRSEKLYVKRFQEEQDVSVLILLDNSESMRTPAEDKKWERARDIALSLAYVALLQQDTVTVALSDGRISPRCIGMRSIHHLSRFLNATVDGKENSIAREARHAVSRVRFPGVAICISDFLVPFEETEAALLAMRSKNLDLTVVQVLGDQDIEPLPGVSSALALDSETGEQIEISLDAEARRGYAQMLEEHRGLVEQYCGECRAHYALFQGSQSILDFITNELSLVGLVSA